MAVVRKNIRWHYHCSRNPSSLLQKYIYHQISKIVSSFFFFSWVKDLFHLLWHVIFRLLSVNSSLSACTKTWVAGCMCLLGSGWLCHACFIDSSHCKAPLLSWSWEFQVAYLLSAASNVAKCSGHSIKTFLDFSSLFSQSGCSSIHEFSYFLFDIFLDSISPWVHFMHCYICNLLLYIL